MRLAEFLLNKRELPSKILEQKAVKTRPKIEEHMLIVKDKSTHEQHLSQPLQTNIKQFKKAVTFLTGYNGIFNVTDRNDSFYFIKSITAEDGYIQTNIPQSSYEIESLKDESKRNIIEEGQCTEVNHPFTIKPIFSTIGSTITISTQGPIITFKPDDSIRDLLRYNKTTLYEEYNLSPNPVDILSFDNIFVETILLKD